ncbi:MAG: helix-turn-helix domain-containing protein [Planctomycetota bacterium]
MTGDSQFGLEIKLLREQKHLSAKDLAEQVGLSPSQMSRLESGQRRIDAVLLSKIARALDVHPSHFFGGESPPPDDEGEPSLSDSTAGGAVGEAVMLSTAPSQLGKLIRAERRRRHLTAEELAQKIGKGRAFVVDLENARNDLVTGDVLQKIAKVLKLDAEVLLEAQRNEIRELRRSLRRLERAHTERTLGDLELEGPGVTKRGVPLVEAEGGELPHVFDKGAPEGRVLDYLYLPGLRATLAFAVVWRGEEMLSQSPPSFRTGDVLVFDADRDARHRELVLAVVEGRSLFRRLHLDAKGRVRLQPLNLDFPPAILHRDEVRDLFPLAAHLQLH